MRNTTLLVALTIALTAPVLAGCVSDKGDKAPADDGGVTVTGDGGPTKAAGAPNLNDKTDPTAHYHHYWGDPPLEQVSIFDGDVLLEGPNLEHFNKGTLYWAEFGLEKDGDDVTRTDEPINPSNGRADTVFVGTKEIRVEVSYEIDGVSAVYLQWKPANTNRFKPENGGQAFFAGQTAPVTIPLTEVGQSDPPHQFAVSRWRFRIWVASEHAGVLGQSDLPPPPGIAPESSVHLKMTAVNGGESFLDPPHPNFWTEGDQISLGSTGTVTLSEPAVFTPVLRERNPALTDIPIPPGNIVPLGTESVIVRLKADTTVPPTMPEGFRLAIAYHGADKEAYEFPNPVPGTLDADGWLVWHIPTASEEDPEAEVKVDPPYESNSMWRFEIVPIVNDGADTAEDPNGDPVNVQRYVGVWQGSYEMEFEAVKQPGFVLV